MGICLFIPPSLNISTYTVKLFNYIRLIARGMFNKNLIIVFNTLVIWKNQITPKTLLPYFQEIEQETLQKNKVIR